MLRSASRGHDKLWRKGQVASVRYSLLNGGKNFLGIGMVHLAAAPSVFHHILDHRQQSAVRIGAGDYLNVYVGNQLVSLNRRASCQCLASDMHGLLRL